MKTIRLKKKEERRILRGHPWVFSNELQGIPAGTIPGEIVDVLDFSGAFIGAGTSTPFAHLRAALTRSRRDRP
jgi:23S rRNA (cytosine1962-C5)-methyltransferase